MGYILTSPEAGFKVRAAPTREGGNMGLGRGAISQVRAPSPT